MRGVVFALAFTLAGCRGSIEIPPQASQPVIQIPPGDTVIEKGGAEIIEPPKAMCSARAAHFRGLVSVPCEDIARQIRP